MRYWNKLKKQNNQDRDKKGGKILSFFYKYYIYHNINYKTNGLLALYLKSGKIA